ncbi:TPA: DNA primase, partial [Raoultella ornithinolytica]
MKLAPNLKHLPKEKFTEAVIFAGTDAYAHAKGWEEGMGKQVAEDRTPPIYLGPKQLAELENLQIIDKGRRSARVYLAGSIEPIMINAIGEKLAQAGVLEAKLYKGIPDQKPENWRQYLARLREQSEHTTTSILKTNKSVNGDNLKPHVESRADGIFLVEPKSDKDTGEITTRENWLCSALEVIGTGIDDSKTRYLILRWHPFGSKGDTVQAIPFADIGEREGWRTLKAGGVNVTTKSGLRATLADWL